MRKLLSEGLRKKTLITKCIKGIKVGDSLLRDESGNLFSINPDTFYERNIEGFWMLRKKGVSWSIVRYFKDNITVKQKT